MRQKSNRSHRSSLAPRAARWHNNAQTVRPTRTRRRPMMTEEHKRFYQENGYVVVEDLFAPDEIARYREHYMTLRRHGSYPGDLVGADPASNDPLKRYPRMIHMH